MESFVCISLWKKLETGKAKGRIWGGRQKLWGLAQLCSCLSQSWEAIGSGVSFWDPLLSAPAQYSRCTQLTCPLGTLGLHRPRAAYNLSGIPMCLRRRKTRAMSQSESLNGWQSGRGVVTALSAMSPAPRLDLVIGDSRWFSRQQPNKDLKQLLCSPELHSPGKGLCRQWLPNTALAVYIPL